MALVPIILPQLGESIAEATIVSIDVKVGDQVETDQNVMEVETTKAATHVTSPTRGIVRRIIAVPGQSYAVEFRDKLSGGAWQTLTNLGPATNSATVSITDAVIGPQHFYRVVSF